MTQQRITNLSVEEMETFFLLLPRIFCDYRDPSRGPYKIAFIYSNTPDNEDSSFLKAIELVNAGTVESLGTSEGERGRGYEGFDHSVERLKILGLKNNMPIVKFNVEGYANTGSEAQKLAEYARTIADGDIAIIAPPFHMVRVFMTTVTALKRNDVSIRAYAVPGIPLPWLQEATHSQGIIKNIRSELLVGELHSLEKYRAAEFGSMLSAKDVIEYLNWRDG
jgi:hypothetical protein